MDFGENLYQFCNISESKDKVFSSMLDLGHETGAIGIDMPLQTLCFASWVGVYE